MNKKKYKNAKIMIESVNESQMIDFIMIKARRRKRERIPFGEIFFVFLLFKLKIVIASNGLDEVS